MGRVPVEIGLSGKCVNSGEDDRDSDCGVIDVGVSGGVGVDHLRVPVARGEGTVGESIQMDLFLETVVRW